MKVIDSHQHFWTIKKGFYTWLTPDLGEIYKDFVPDDLEPLLKEAGVDQTIIVQAADSIEETDYLLSLAEKYHFLSGVVGWIDMEDPSQLGALENLSKRKEFKGIRPLIQDIPDTNWMLQKNLAWAFEALEKLNLTFDALVKPPHLDNLLILVERYPHLSIVIDHAAKPCIKNGVDGEGGFNQWAPKMGALAKKKNVYCKISGLLTEAQLGATLEDLEPYLDHLFRIFGADRLLWGSDWPVVNLAGNYSMWWEMSQKYFEKLVPDELEAVLGRTASNFYNVET